MIPLVPYASDGLLPVFRAHGVMCVTGMFTEPEARALRERVARTFNPSEWTVRNKPSGSLPRVLLMKRTGDAVLRAVWRRLGEFRNFLAGQRPTWALDGPEDGWWTDTRLNLYPSGGGFMGEHSDAAYVGAEPPGGFVQPLLLLSQKWEHFQLGGGFVRLHGQAYPTDNRIGDVVVYNGTIPHGVKLVDPEVVVDLTKLTGRLVAAVTPLRVRP